MLKFLLVVILIAVAVYLTARVIQRRGIAPTPRRSQQPPPRPFGPDDDPDFLRDLDRRRKHPEDPDAP
ncbi:hypothetical protein H5V45_08615 [Nocardioides sp. KIGAM211]|uniref:Uncharacterized protein n=1 Tax=Nocardioides luti TaxID=2761101 RepID=A0A7X0RFK0_9ACTN|nr:hypothetical protein [Nocardioides luti]MBB6627381.1 hypothetical protein [Nocardioides luti]